MDSLSQFVLGAAIGEVTLGKKLGNKALLLGGIAGTIPDLDVLFNPFLDTVGELTFHRSVSHSLLFMVIGGWLFAWLAKKWSTSISFNRWYVFFFLAFSTHSLLDCCTTWGTQLFWPFSSYGVAFYNVFVVDPLYTIPFLIALPILLFLKKENPTRQKLVNLALGLSTLYLIFGFSMQQIATSHFKTALEDKGVKINRYITKPTPFNTLLWSITAETEEGYYTGFYSVLDDSQNEISFGFAPKNHDLLKPYSDHKDLQRLLQVTKGFYTVEKAGEKLLVNDLRFGQFNGWLEADEAPEYVFIYQVIPSEDGIFITQDDYRKVPDEAYMKEFFNRVAGK
ncbi:metal-dependent hydrolase [Sediminitomix flava]|uniref:Inner membrane protein n=1 Tax=Sediminitomix flava TaxID=379075 RepID=A0A315YWH2_SEDFL|nr:metal-dependent hydrolase [Sediminitomix flava]PWJ34120.1 inner membrane protein [Sediminitomix flava]